MKKYFCVACGRMHNGNQSSRYCGKHQWQINKYGRVLDNNPRNRFDPNEFRFIDGYVEFDTYDVRTSSVKSTYKIDIEDYEAVKRHKWCTANNGYAKTSKFNGETLLHRIIMNPMIGQQVDHINGDITDNRRSNLRLCNNSLNQSNRKGYCNIGVKGVSLQNSGTYMAHFRIESKRYYSNCYATVEEASFARFILEQLFRREPLNQFHEDLHNTLTEEQKESIISDVKNKYNIE